MDCLRSGVRGQPGQHGKTSSLLKNTKISLVWWQVSVISATWEAEAELLELMRQRCELRSYHYTPTWATEQDLISKINKIE